MRFARKVFIGAGIWGVLILSTLFFLLGGPRFPLHADGHPELAYGFVAVAMAWQIAFLLIGSDPVRLRPLMIPAVVEKLGYVATVIVFIARGMLPAADAAPAVVPDFVLGIFFIAAWVKTAGATRDT